MKYLFGGKKQTNKQKPLSGKVRIGSSQFSFEVTLEKRCRIYTLATCSFAVRYIRMDRDKDSGRTGRACSQTHSPRTLPQAQMHAPPPQCRGTHAQSGLQSIQPRADTPHASPLPAEQGLTAAALPPELSPAALCSLLQPPDPRPDGALAPFLPETPAAALAAPRLSLERPSLSSANIHFCKAELQHSLFHGASPKSLPAVGINELFLCVQRNYKFPPLITCSAELESVPQVGRDLGRQEAFPVWSGVSSSGASVHRSTARTRWWEAGTRAESTGPATGAATPHVTAASPHRRLCRRPHS